MKGTTSTKRMISMPCDIESRRAEPGRRAAWHRDCPCPLTCGCPAHANQARRAEAAQ